MRRLERLVEAVKLRLLHGCQSGEALLRREGEYADDQRWVKGGLIGLGLRWMHGHLTGLGRRGLRCFRIHPACAFAHGRTAQGTGAARHVSAGGDGSLLLRFPIVFLLSELDAGNLVFVDGAQCAVVGDGRLAVDCLADHRVAGEPEEQLLRVALHCGELGKPRVKVRLV